MALAEVPPSHASRESGQERDSPGQPSASTSFSDLFEGSPEKTPWVPAILRDFATDMFSDTRALVSAPLDWNQEEWLEAGSFGLFTAGLFLLDTEVRNDADRIERRGSLSPWIRPLGRATGFGVLAGGFLASGYLLDRAEDYQTTRMLLEAALIDQALVEGLKLSVGRFRPNERSDGDEFRPFSTNRSFPSGETSLAFTVAGVLSGQYDDWKVKVLSYGLATAVGAARIAEDGHWSSDVFVGGLMGYAVSKEIVRRKQERLGPRPSRSERGEKSSRLFFFPGGFEWRYEF
ncbi:MAG: phosphatase PAP2 family protein [Planctomycetes bacterium]|nr:phosphatase PAP2 family protein [Planctomycetota bacterium]